MDRFSYLGNADVNAVEALYQKYLSAPEQVDATWHDFFKGFEFAQQQFPQLPGQGSATVPDTFQKELKVLSLIQGYRSRGHLFTKTNPVRQRRTYAPDLSLKEFGLAEADLQTVFQAAATLGLKQATLSDIIAHLQQTYCNSIGAEYLYMRDPNLISWMEQRMESCKNTAAFDTEKKLEIYSKLCEAVVFEQFLATKFVGQKRFSLEGGESFLAALQQVILQGARQGIIDFVIGMAHRGRLNVLANIMQKPAADIFTEFEGRPSEDSVFDGDVKYHMGYSADVKTPDGKTVHISLTPNPSHLETVGPVVLGITRAKRDGLHQRDESKVCPILVHGDAAIAGQGVVYEVAQMAELEAYRVGGTLHFVINNQVGFTTNYTDARTSTYCTDIAKVTKCPVFHVNGDDVEALCLVTQFALEFRQTFKKDVYIDILCYRKYGHNEGDEPRFTQPLLYKAISTHPNPKEIYQNRLISNNDFTKEALHAIEKKYKTVLESELDIARKRETLKVNSYLQGAWSGIRMAKAEDFYNSPQSGITDDVFLNLANRITTLPPNTTFFNKIQRLYQDRKTMITQNSYDWAMGELMAYASLLHEGHTVRFSGQDVERGTFSHRHAVVKIEDSEDEYEPLAQVSAHAKLEIYNSLLSEYGVLGFEYGYAFAAPNTLTIWEAQFGDFFNGAQIIIDQYLSSSEYKWRRMNGLVVLLPHGYEGQGPEHSSARMERFLQMCAEDNMQIVNATTPAQQFHVLRRQLKWPFRKPLICFTPKKLLRFPECVSTRADFTSTTNFQEVLNDPAVTTPEAVHTVVLCSGKVYYDLAAYKRDHQLAAFAIIRLEQLYPFPYTQLERILKLYTKATTFLYVQEEPENMGSWRFAEHHLRKLSKHLVLQSGALLLWNYCGRKESASPATGFSKRHQAEHDELLKQVFVSAQTPSPLNV